MHDTYGTQREFINSREPVHNTAEVKEEWPLLFLKPFFYQHANELLGKDVKITFEQHLASCSCLLINYLEGSVKKDIVYQLAQVELEVQNGNEKAREQAVLPLLASYFKNERGVLYLVFEEGTSIVEKVPDLPSTPIVVALGSIFKGQCFVYCEKEALLSEPSDFNEAVCVAFLAYYVFNLEYPSKAATTLEFVQRQLFDINPSSGSKWKGGQKSRTAVHSKIMTLAQNLRL